MGHTHGATSPWSSGLPGPNPKITTMRQLKPKHRRRGSPLAGDNGCGRARAPMARAKAAAGDRNVLVHGAYTAQRALEAGVLDELQIHQIPVLFGAGRRLFEVLPSRVEL